MRGRVNAAALREKQGEKTVCRRDPPLVPVAACLVVQLCVGIIYLWSVFNEPVTHSFQMTQSAGCMVSSYMLIAFVLGCLSGGVVNDAKGPRFTVTVGVLMFGTGVGSSAFVTAQCAFLLNITYALLGGLGAGFGYTACLGCVQKWFPDRRGFASGLAAAAFGFSTVVFAPLCRWLIDCFTSAETGVVDFKAVFLILGGIFLALGLGASRFVRLPAADSSQALAAAAHGEGAQDSVYPDSLRIKEVVSTVPFWCIFFTIFFSTATWTLVLPLISDLGVERGLSLSAATLTVSLTGVANTAGRLALTSLSDRIGRRAVVVLLSGLTIAGALALTFIGGAGYSIAILVIAFAYGGPGPLAAAFAGDFFGAKNSSRNFGLITLSLGLTSILCSLISSYLLHGSPTKTFIMAAVMASVPIGLMSLLKHNQEKRLAYDLF